MLRKKPGSRSSYVMSFTNKIGLDVVPRKGPSFVNTLIVKMKSVSVKIVWMKKMRKVKNMMRKPMMKKRKKGPKRWKGKSGPKMKKRTEGPKRRKRWTKMRTMKMR